LIDFLAAAMHLHRGTCRTLEMLKFRYSMLTNTDERPGNLSPKRHSPFNRRKHRDDDNDFEIKPHDRSPSRGECENKRRNAFELQREELNLEQGLADVTNRITHRGDDRLAGGAHLPGLGGETYIDKDSVVPRPLFSPRRGPALIHLAPPDYQSMPERERTPEKLTWKTKGGHSFTEMEIGSAQFYEAEIEDMARQAFGGSFTSTRGHTRYAHGSIEKEDKDEDDCAARGKDDDGNDKARNIWERMRVGSEGSGASGESTEGRYGDESEDGAERARDCKLVGAPWLA